MCKDKIQQYTSNPRKSNILSHVYDTYERKNWYSLAPCQFCYCVNENKLLCNRGRYLTKKLELRNYNLSVCGEDLIKEAIELIPDIQNTLRQNKKKDVAGYLEMQQNKFSSIVNTSFTIIDIAKEENNIAIEVNREGNEDENIVLGNINKKDSSSKSDEDIENKEAKIITRKEETKSNTPKTIQGNTDFLKFSLPTVLKNVLKMVLRKSMVTLNNDSKCVPGSTEVLKCNTFFCLKNSKMLCTNKVCE
ncbi:uncharacterized protein LOC113511217 [Galleria mellonella]|uniref:Uncharacterized protein LOC113511217 n=1 Tax=Galleria mellonella TaxID=7137 RepID=A0ABM3MYG4_GALME|nr:uncharacterized protein LOC113511217 [Galleria mellonella]